MKLLSNQDIETLLPMPAAIDIVAKTLTHVSKGTETLPLRTAIPVGGENLMGIMPGAITDPACYGVKLVSLFPGNPAKGLSSHQGAVVLFKAETGAAMAIMDAGLLTAIRTAAASGVATKALAREDAKTLTLIGYGEQAEHHLDAICAVRTIEHVIVAGRNTEKANAFTQVARKKYPDLSFSVGKDIKSAVEAADIICTVTSSSTPILEGKWMKPGTHLNIVGSSIPTKREVDDETVLKSSIWVDYWPSTEAQAGEIVDMMKEGKITKTDIKGEIGAVLNGSISGRTGATEITTYRSLGIAAQDLATAHYVMEKAIQLNVGMEFEF